MAVYKSDLPGSPDVQKSNSGREPSLVAFVDSRRPRVSRVANAMKVEGQLEPSLTSITVELFKQGDCQAEFTCEVFAVDAQGREVVRTSHLLLQHPTPASDMAGHEGWTPAVAMHLVELTQQLNTNVELVKNSMNDYGDRMADLEKEFRDKFDLFENRMSDKVASLEKDLLKVSLSQEGADAKLISTFQTIEDKLTDQEDREGLLETRLQNKMDEIKDSQSSLKSCDVNLNKHIRHILKMEFESLGMNVSKVSGDFAMFESQMEQKVESLKQELHKCESVLTTNMIDAIEQSSLTTTNEVLSRVNDSLSLVDETIEGHFQEVSSVIKESNVETRSFIGQRVDGINITDPKEVASAVRDMLAPKACRRGQISLWTQASYPFPVVSPGTDDPLAVPYLCDSVTDGGGWIIIQRRTTGNVNFYRNWADYKTGFGTLDDDFWLGNDNIHAITSSGEYELRVELRYNGKSAYAHYDKFALADELGKYALTLGSYYGTAGDSLSGHAGLPFTTLDRDHDTYSSNCAVVFTGAWWYGACHSSNLNGKWGEGKNKGPRWSALTQDNAVSFSEMKIRKIIASS